MGFSNPDEIREKLAQLRADIVLCSLYTIDYENSFGIDRHQVQDFFDGYLEYLGELAHEDYKNGETETDFSQLDDLDAFLDRYDNTDNLERWYDIVIGSGCAAFEL